MPTLEGKTAIITGASSGIGQATAHFLGREGARLVLNARREERLKSIPDATAVVGDITDPGVRAGIIEACGGRVDILVNNAGYGEPGPVETVPEDDYRRQLEVNLFAAGAMIQAVLPAMRRRRSGRIINISSVAGRLGYPLFGWYCASKHALEGLSDALRNEVAPWGVRVVLIEPGPVRTEFFDVTKGKIPPYLSDDSPYRAFFEHADTIEADFMKHATSAEAVAAVILKACCKARPRARYAVTMLARMTILATRFLPRSLLDALVRKQFRVPGPADVV